MDATLGSGAIDIDKFNVGGTSNPWKGGISDLRIYDRANSDAQIDNIHAFNCIFP